ncbi:CDC42 small effector protein 1 [Gadus morhua]|nr:CDC42 small effector protein 1-like [Gadus morhua]XP_056438670.1 CDC42 small effector protein 1 [Gadus chalcogrammus]
MPHSVATETNPSVALRVSRSLGMSEFWHKMGCCVVATQPQKRRRRPKIDLSMIGEPTNFMHLTHIGSGEMADGPSGSMQEQMRSKGPPTNGRNSLL